MALGKMTNCSRQRVPRALNLSATQLQLKPCERSIIALKFVYNTMGPLLRYYTDNELACA